MGRPAVRGPAEDVNILQDSGQYDLITIRCAIEASRATDKRVEIICFRLGLRVWLVCY